MYAHSRKLGPGSSWKSRLPSHVRYVIGVVRGVHSTTWAVPITNENGRVMHSSIMIWHSELRES